MMFIDKIFKRKAKEEVKEECSLKSCPMCVNNIDELLQIDSDEYILKENETLVRIGEEIYIYRNNEFKLHYNFSIEYILNYGFEKFVKILQSDGSKFEVVKKTETLYGYTFREIDRVDIEIKWQ